MYTKIKNVYPQHRSILNGRQSNLCSIGSCQRQPQILRPGIRIATFDRLKLLHNPSNSVSSFGQRELLAYAYPRTSVERKVRPTRPDLSPSLWAEFVRIRSKDFGVAVQCVYAKDNLVALGYVNGGFSIRATADRKIGVSFGLANIEGDDWVQTQSCI